MNKLIYILGAVLIAAFAAVGMVRVIQSRTPHVMRVSDARSIKDRPFEFTGSIVRGKTWYDDGADELVFTLRDDRGETIIVRYKGLKPPGFDRARRAIVRGGFYAGEIVAGSIVLNGEER